MEDLSKLEDTEITRRLSSLIEELEELEAERDFVLKQPGVHLPGSKVGEYEAHSKKLQECIAGLRAEIKRRGL